MKQYFLIHFFLGYKYCKGIETMENALDILLLSLLLLLLLLLIYYYYYYKNTVIKHSLTASYTFKLSALNMQ